MTGIDLGSNAAKVVVRRGSAVVGAHRSPLPADMIDNADALASWLAAWLAENGDGNCRSISLSPPSAMVAYETVDLSAGEAAENAPELAARAAAEIERLLGADAERASYDYWTTPAEMSQPARLHLAWTDGEFAARLVARLARKGWFCGAIDAPGAALSRVAAGDECARGDCLMVDVGGAAATFAYRREGLARFVRSGIAFSSASAAQTLAAALGIREQAAEALLEYRGLGVGNEASEGQAPLETLVLKHLADWLESLSFEIERTLRYGHRLHPGPQAWTIGLCGGGACLRGLDRWLAQRLRVAVFLAESPRGLAWRAAEPFSPRYALASALAVREEV